MRTARISGVVLLLLCAEPLRAAVDSLVDPLEPEASRARTEGLAGCQAPSRPRGLRLLAGVGDPDAELQAAWIAEVDSHVTLDLLVVGLKDERAAHWLGTYRMREGWSGRVMRGLIRYKSPAIELDFGRGRPASWMEGEDHPAMGAAVRPVDLARVSMKAPRWGLVLNTVAISLPSAARRSGFRRWMGGHQLQWSGGPWEASLGDWVLYTGLHRGLEPAYINPLLPAFVGTFERIPVADSTSRHDNDNNQVTASVAWRRQVQEHAWRIRLDVVIDELQIDAADRARMQDVLGARAVLVHTLRNDRGVWQVALRGSRLSTWLYQHPGEETDWTAHGQGLGHPSGGDLLEGCLRLAWHPIQSPKTRGWRFWPEGCGAALETGWQVKGSVNLEDAWDPIATREERSPTDPVTRRQWAVLDVQVGWQLRQRLVVQCLATGHVGQLPEASINTLDTKLILRLGFGWE